MRGFMGKVLRVNLTEGKHKVEPLNEEWTAEFLGGRGLAVRMYMSETDPGVDPLSAENKLVLACGPLVGTGVVSAASCYVVGKSSLTGGIACAKTRGHFGAELKFAGFDAIIIEGASQAPVILSIMDDRVGLKPAIHLWGRTTVETERVFKSEIEDPWAARETHMAVIGPAGENQVRMATLTNGGFLSVGGAGLGAVFGSKNLKGIAVRGKHSVRVADGARLVQVVNTMIGKLNSSLVTSQLMPQWGTAFLVRMCDKKGMMPWKNFSGAALKNGDNLGTDSIARAFAMQSRGCFACPMACLKKADLNYPPYLGRGVAPTFMAIGSLGTNLGITDMEAIGRANALCAGMGLDPVATGGLFATAMEILQTGAASSSDLKMELAFGDAESLVKGMEMVSTKKGHARRLGVGGLALAREYGAEKAFMGVKGMPLASFDPRAIQGLGLHFATCNQGPHHTYGYSFIDEILGVHEEVDPQAVEDKPRLVTYYQNTTAAMDSLGICNWVLFGLKFKNLVPMANAVLGEKLTADDLMLIGERVVSLERLFNLRAGLSGGDDRLPVQFTDEPLTEGPAQGRVSKANEMLPEYYELRGWTPEGEPSPETLERLGLKGV